MNAEEFLEQEFGITFIKKGDSFHNEIANDWLNSLEAYHKAKVNSITDGEINDKVSSYERTDIFQGTYRKGFVEGVKWFKEKLLKQ